tara:strand:+ start:140 stop:619 length:480 start_codon:yes stop_codon:yes gene_type:complete
MITQDELKELLSYCPDTGIFTWVSGKRKGRVAGCSNGIGYIRIVINGERYGAHRLAWLYSYGSFPVDMIDHINGVKDDNRIVNIRNATCSQNQINRAIQSSNTSGIKGVSWNKGAKKWKVQIRIYGKKVYLGYFSDKDEAGEAYRKAADKHHGEFANYG